jgi:mannan endo-1,6-alpha-mannosidase
MKSWVRSAAVTLGLLGVGVRAIDVQFNDENSVKNAAKLVAGNMMKYYTGNQPGDTPGNLPDPYYWWECGAMFGTMVDYWYITGDDSYNDITRQALVHQATPEAYFEPKNQSLQLGNDDQGFWVMSAMTAAENVFPNPADDEPQYLAMAQAVFNRWVSRWDNDTCGGGMHWQIFPGNAGYNFKNTISNGCFFNIATRLARFTGNETYALWANTIWDWHAEYKIITSDLQVLDGLHLNADGSGGNCDKIDLIQWSYNIGIFLHGAAVMANFADDKQKWVDRVNGLLEHIQNKFVKSGVFFEQFCEEAKQCNLDQRSFKGYLTRWMAWTSRLVPETADTIAPIIEKSGEAAMKVCTGSPAATEFKGEPGTACGFSWLTSEFDGQTGVGEQMNALDTLMYTMIDKVELPATTANRGTSKGNPNGGSSGGDINIKFAPITTGDRVGAGFLTTLVIVGLLGGCTTLIL